MLTFSGTKISHFGADNMNANSQKTPGRNNQEIEMKVQSGFKAVFSPELNCDVVTPDHNSTPILCSYLSSSSKKEDNLYNTPGHTEPTYQSIFTPEMGGSVSKLSLEHNMGLKPSIATSVMTYLSPCNLENFKPLDKTCDVRTPVKKFKVKRSWFGVTQILCGLMGLVMNIETFIFFPQFLLEWRGDGLMIYLLVLALIGVPIFLMENIIGSLERSSSLFVWSTLVPVMSGLGPALLTASLFLVTKASTLTSYSIMYSINSLFNPFPWTLCESWWGADDRCIPSSDIEHQFLNKSLLCNLYNLAGDQCHQHLEPSHVQFWKKYILQTDEYGLRALGDLGSLNIQLVIVSAVLWILTGCIVPLLKKHVLGVASVLSVLLLCLVGAVSIRNLVKQDVLQTFKMVLSLSPSHSYRSPGCWLDAFYLVTTGLSIFSGPVGTYTSLSDGSRSNKLISSAAIMFHLLFLVLSSLCILPLLPDNLDIKDIREKNEIGYFPLALVPVLLSGYKDGEYFVLVIFLAIALSGFNLMLGVSTNIVSICALSYSRSRFKVLIFCILLSLLGFLLSLPLIFQNGSSILVLYHKYGYNIPIFVLGNLLSISVFWCYGVKRLSLRTKGTLFQLVFKFLWFINPLFIFGLVVTYFVVWPSVPQPSPLPPWAFNLGIFFSLVSIIQVPIGSAITSFKWMYTGYGSQLFGRAGHRTKGENIDLNGCDSSSYKSYNPNEDFYKN